MLLSTATTSAPYCSTSTRTCTKTSTLIFRSSTELSTYYATKEISLCNQTAIPTGSYTHTALSSLPYGTGVSSHLPSASESFPFDSNNSTVVHPTGSSSHPYAPSSSHFHASSSSVAVHASGTGVSSSVYPSFCSTSTSICTETSTLIFRSSTEYSTFHVTHQTPVCNGTALPTGSASRPYSSGIVHTTSSSIPSGTGHSSVPAHHSSSAPYPTDSGVASSRPAGTGHISFTRPLGTGRVSDTTPASSGPSAPVQPPKSSEVPNHTVSTSASIPLGTGQASHSVPLGTGYSSSTVPLGTVHSSANISPSTGQPTSSVPFYPSQSSNVPEYSPSSSVPSTYPASSSNTASSSAPASSPSSYTDPNGIVYTIQWDKTCKGTVVLPAAHRKRDDTTTAGMVGCMVSCDETDGCVGVDVEDGTICTLYSEITEIDDEVGSVVCQRQPGSGSSGTSASRSATISVSGSASASATISESLATGISTTSASETTVASVSRSSPASENSPASSISTSSASSSTSASETSPVIPKPTTLVSKSSRTETSTSFTHHTRDHTRTHHTRPHTHTAGPHTQTHKTHTSTTTAPAQEPSGGNAHSGSGFPGGYANGQPGHNVNNGHSQPGRYQPGRYSPGEAGQATISPTIGSLNTMDTT